MLRHHSKSDVSNANKLTTKITETSSAWNEMKRCPFKNKNLLLAILQFVMRILLHSVQSLYLKCLYTFNRLWHFNWTHTRNTRNEIMNDTHDIFFQWVATDDATLLCRAYQAYFRIWWVCVMPMCHTQLIVWLKILV